MKEETVQVDVNNTKWFGEKHALRPSIRGWLGRKKFDKLPTYAIFQLTCMLKAYSLSGLGRWTVAFNPQYLISAFGICFPCNVSFKIFFPSFQLHYKLYFFKKNYQRNVFGEKKYAFPILILVHGFLYQRILLHGRNMFGWLVRFDLCSWTENLLQILN